MARPLIGKVEVLEAITASGADDFLRGRGDLGLQFPVFEYRLDDQVATGQVRIAFGGVDSRQNRFTLLGAHLAARDFLVQQRRRMRLALLGCREVDVLEHHFDTGRCADKRDARAHHPGAEHPDFLRHIGRKTLGPRTAGIDFVELEPEGADQVLRDLAGGQFGEVTGFDQVRRVEIHLGAFNRGAEDFLRRGHAALGFAAQDRRRNRQHLRDFRVRRCATGNLIALHVPALNRCRVGENPGARLAQQLVAICRQFIDQSRLQRLLRADFLAFEQIRQGFFDAQHAHHAHHPAAARQQAEGHFRQAELHGWIVQRHAVMAGQADFPATAQRCAVDRGDHRFAEGFQGAQLPLEGQHHVVERFGFGFADLDQLIEVAAGEEGFLGRGDDDAGDVVLVGHQAGDAGGHGFAVDRVHGVGALARHVDGQDDDLVLAFFVTNGFAHEQCSLKSRAQRRSMMVAMPMPPPTHRVARP